MLSVFVFPGRFYFGILYDVWCLVNSMYLVCFCCVVSPWHHQSVNAINSWSELNEKEKKKSTLSSTSLQTENKVRRKRQRAQNNQNIINLQSIFYRDNGVISIDSFIQYAISRNTTTLKHIQTYVRTLSRRDRDTIFAKTRNRAPDSSEQERERVGTKFCHELKWKYWFCEMWMEITKGRKFQIHSADAPDIYIYIYMCVFVMAMK